MDISSHGEDCEQSVVTLSAMTPFVSGALTLQYRLSASLPIHPKTVLPIEAKLNSLPSHFNISLSAELNLDERMREGNHGPIGRV
jgi:hypothetical protein